MERRDGVRTIFDTCDPRTEVFQGELKEEIFAARLKDVLDGKAERVYQDPATFFDTTYPTAGLKDLLSEALGRLSGVQDTCGARGFGAGGATDCRVGGDVH